MTLTPANGCQLLLVARGNGNAIATLSNNKSLSDVQVMEADASVIKATDPSSSEDMKKMPYVLYLENVNVVQVDGKYVIRSPEGSYDIHFAAKASGCPAHRGVDICCEWIYFETTVAPKCPVKLCGYPYPR